MFKRKMIRKMTGPDAASATADGLLFICCSQLVKDLLIAKRDLAMSKVVKKLSCDDAVIIDDIGYVQHSRRQIEVRFTLLADGYERGPG
jgi:DNA replication protein DnaC